jgi:hypothetical protein
LGNLSSTQTKEKPSYLWLAIVLTLLVTFAVTFLTYAGEYRWLGHATISLVGLGLIIIAVVNGATITGRLKRGAKNAFRLHKNVSVIFSVFMVGTFFFGIWVTYSHGEEVLTSIHSWIGLAIVILAIIQVVPCFVTKRRGRIRFVHMIFGFSTVLLVVIQTAWGLEIAVVGEIKDLVIIHSTFGAIAAFALTWIIVEMRHLTPKGLARAKIASYVAAFFNVVGCWIVGGYYYLTVYASQLKPIIVEGTQPWAHQILMETKEHVFLFLPVIVLALMQMLIWLSKDQTLLENPNARKAILAVALLALVMIIATFVFGAFISNAANIGAGGG